MGGAGGEGVRLETIRDGGNFENRRGVWTWNVDLKTERQKNKQLLLTKETYNVTKRAELRSHDLFSW